MIIRRRLCVGATEEVIVVRPQSVNVSCWHGSMANNLTDLVSRSAVCSRLSPVIVAVTFATCLFSGKTVVNTLLQG